MKDFLFRRLPALVFGRNSIAILIAFATISLLYFQFQAKPAGADPKAALKIHQLEQMIPTQVAELTLPESGSVGQADGQPAVGTLTGTSALMMNLLVLEKGYERFSKVTDYTTTFVRQERTRGKMQPSELVSMKMRHTPFSIYLKWLTGKEGQEVIYVAGENDGNMIVHPSGWRSKVVSSIELDPLGSTAMKDARYPITDAGILNLMKTLISNRKRDLEKNIGSNSLMLDNQVIEDQDCYCFMVDYTEADRKKLPEGDIYRKSIVYIDKVNLLPIHIQNYTWATEEERTKENMDELTMIERYTYKEVKFNQKLASKDFDQANTDYHFIRR